MRQALPAQDSNSDSSSGSGSMRFGPCVTHHVCSTGPRTEVCRLFRCIVCWHQRYTAQTERRDAQRMVSCVQTQRGRRPRGGGRVAPDACSAIADSSTTPSIITTLAICMLSMYRRRTYCQHIDRSSSKCRKAGIKAGWRASNQHICAGTKHGEARHTPHNNNKHPWARTRKQNRDHQGVSHFNTASTACTTPRMG